MTILEAYRGLLASNFSPVHDVEFHWYSAVRITFRCILIRPYWRDSLPTDWNYSSFIKEEGGLLGSQAVANDYLSRDVKVKAVLHVRTFRFHISVVHGLC